MATVPSLDYTASTNLSYQDMPPLTHQYLVNTIPDQEYAATPAKKTTWQKHKGLIIAAIIIASAIVMVGAIVAIIHFAKSESNSVNPSGVPSACSTDMMCDGKCCQDGVHILNGVCSCTEDCPIRCATLNSDVCCPVTHPCCNGDGKCCTTSSTGSDGIPVCSTDCVDGTPAG